MRWEQSRIYTLHLDDFSQLQINYLTKFEFIFDSFLPFVASFPILTKTFSSSLYSILSILLLKSKTRPIFFYLSIFFGDFHNMWNKIRTFDLFDEGIMYQPDELFQLYLHPNGKNDYFQTILRVKCKNKTFNVY